MGRIIIGAQLSQLFNRENNQKGKKAQDQSPLWQISLTSINGKPGKA